ncbi:MAG: GNAT family N-acetyltransferase [Provencibacterium sp.]|jgi:GNAT superfamily N-acetyltransferase|nr:GNAT family N-acetyltransferase [Provencibacterium sp.]
MEDRDFWFRLDSHLPAAEFEKKVRDRQGYLLLADETPAGLLRYNLFWDHIPFCNLLFIDREYRRRGYGRLLMIHWEEQMKAQGCGMLMVSTQVDEQAQHFYRKLGYQDAGGLLLSLPGYEQPMELFLVKGL